MTVENLFTDVLNNIVKAQYESYVFSQGLGEQDKYLLPIPTAEIKEITLDINYAYEDQGEIKQKDSYQVHMIYNKITDILGKLFSQCQKRIVEEINMSEESSGEQWSKTKNKLLMADLTEYMLSQAKASFLVSADNFLNQSANESFNIDEFIGFLISLVRDTIYEYIVKCTEMQSFVKNIDLANVYSFIEIYLMRNKQLVENIIKKSAKPIIDNLNIVVDSRLLENLPPEAIQKAKVVMKMRNIIVEQ